MTPEQKNDLKNWVGLILSIIGFAAFIYYLYILTYVFDQIVKK